MLQLRYWPHSENTHINPRSYQLPTLLNVAKGVTGVTARLQKPSCSWHLVVDLPKRAIKDDFAYTGHILQPQRA